MNRLPQSPMKMVAGLKLYRRNPRMAPARVAVSKAVIVLPSTMATTKTAVVENSAEPAASPSKPSIRLKALVMNTTQPRVSKNDVISPKCLLPNRTLMETRRT